MGTLLAMIISVSVAGGCGHSQTQGTSLIHVLVAPADKQLADEPRLSDGTDQPVSVAPRTVLPVASPPLFQRNGGSRSDGKGKRRWIPEPVAPPQLFHSVPYYNQAVRR